MYISYFILNFDPDLYRKHAGRREKYGWIIILEFSGLKHIFHTICDQQQIISAVIGYFLNTFQIFKNYIFYKIFKYVLDLYFWPKNMGPYREQVGNACNIFPGAWMELQYVFYRTYILISRMRSIIVTELSCNMICYWRGQEQKLCGTSWWYTVIHISVVSINICI